MLPGNSISHKNSDNREGQKLCQCDMTAAFHCLWLRLGVQRFKGTSCRSNACGVQRLRRSKCLRRSKVPGLRCSKCLRRSKVSGSKVPKFHVPGEVRIHNSFLNSVAKSLSRSLALPPQVPGSRASPFKSEHSGDPDSSVGRFKVSVLRLREMQ